MKRILFVCHGNICRSPAAEAIFNRLVKEAGRSDDVMCESAGTHHWHVGNRADQRMRKHLEVRGYESVTTARRVCTDDFDRFDRILVADEENRADIMKFCPDREAEGKLAMMTDTCRTHDVREVPDPYYGGADGFELVIDLLEDACAGLLEKLNES